MKKRYIILGVGVLAVIAAGGLSMRNGGEKAPEVQTTQVEKAKIVQKVNATGKIQPKTQVKISADVSAKITTEALIEMNERFFAPEDADAIALDFLVENGFIDG